MSTATELQYQLFVCYNRFLLIENTKGTFIQLNNRKINLAVIKKQQMKWTKKGTHFLLQLQVKNRF